MNKKQREIIEWILILGIPLTLYLTGWHTEVIGQVQRVILLTDLMAPDISSAADSGESADMSLRLLSPEGEVVELGDFSQKTLFVNFWATWCSPCIAEMPEIQSLYSNSDPEQVAFFLISVDEDWDKARQYVERKSFDFPIFRVKGNIPSSFRSGSIPSTFVIRPDGTIAMKRVGMASYDNPEFRDFLHELNPSRLEKP